MQGSESLVISGLQVHGENHLYPNGYIEIKDGKIQAIGDCHHAAASSGSDHVHTFPEDYVAVPGFVDSHIHGAAGADTMDATPEALATMAETLPQEGTTSFLATTMTQEEEAIEKALHNAGDYMTADNDDGQAQILGIHLEGPFISPEKAGAQPPADIIMPDLDRFQKWQALASDMIKLVTLAPEREGGLALIRHLTETGVVASVGHSNATYEQVVAAVQAGAARVTHLYNGMRGLHHREPGVAGAALLLDDLLAEVIVDGIHTRPEMIDLAYRQKGQNGLVTITDALRAKCLQSGTYDLGGQEVTVANGEARLAGGSLAGSILKMNEAVRNLLAYTKATLADAIQIAAANPAKQLGVYDRKGSLAPGKDGDVVVLDGNLNVVMTFCRGELAYKKGAEPSEGYSRS